MGGARGTRGTRGTMVGRRASSNRLSALKKGWPRVHYWANYCARQTPKSPASPSLEP